MNNQLGLVSVWYNPEINGYQLFDENGVEIPGLLKGSVTIEDNWEPDKGKIPVAKLEILVNIKNERPVLVSETAPEASFS